MASNLQQQAAGYANAAVPTVGSINQQYQTGTNDVHGFTTALIKLLQQGQGQDPYSGAVNSQQAANSEAVQRLSNLGSPYAAGSAAAVGGMGDSALGNLNQQRAAGISYQRQLPSIAAARGELANSTLLTNKQTALTQRSQQYQSAYMQALQQLRDYGLQKQGLVLQANAQRQSAAQFAAQMKQQNAQFAQNQAYNWARLNQASKQFNSTQGQQWREFLISQSQTANSAKWTPSQAQAFLNRAGTGAFAATQHAMGPGDYLKQAVGVNGIPSNFAMLAIQRVYGGLANVNKTQHPKQWAAFQKYKAWVKQIQWQNFVKNEKHAPGPGPHDGG